MGNTPPLPRTYSVCCDNCPGMIWKRHTRKLKSVHYSVMCIFTQWIFFFGGCSLNCSVFLWVFFLHTQTLNVVPLCHCEDCRPNRCLCMRCAASHVHWRMPCKYLQTGNLLIMLLSKATHYTVLFMGISYVNQSTQRLVPKSRCRICDVIFFH